MNALEPGKVVLFYRQTKLCTGLLLASEGQHCQLTDDTGSLLDLPAERFVLVSIQNFLPPDSATLLRFAEELSQISQNLPQQEIVDVLGKLPEPFSFEAACAALDYSDDLRCFALFHLLRKREDVFIFKKGLYRLRSEEERGAYLVLQKQVEERSTYLEEIRAFLQSRQEGKDAGLQPQTRSTLLKELRELLLTQEPKDLAKTLRSFAGTLSPEQQILELRLYLGDILPASDPIAAQSGIPVCFASGLWQQVSDPENYPVAEITAYTIDAEDSPDHDDAYSLQVLPQGFKLGIHISDVAARLPEHSELFAEARERVSSLYLAAESIPLLPPELSGNNLSLLMGETRPVRSLYVTLDKDLNLLEREFRRESIRVTGNYTYNQIDKELAQDQDSQLMRICRKLQTVRTGEQNDNRPRYSWYLKVQDGEILMQRVDNLSPARFIIEELMILYNRLFAEEAMQNNLPLIYRNIAQFASEEDEEEEPVFGSQAYLSTRAKFHPGIGASAYLHATSPIRRFVDIINQAQFEALLDGKDLPYTEAELLELIPAIEKRLLFLRSVAQKSERFWLLGYLRDKHLHTPLDAVLLKKLRFGYLAELTRWDKRIVLRCEDKPPLQVPVKLIIGSVDQEELFVRGDVIF